jgi:ribosomal protein S14
MKYLKKKDINNRIKYLNKEINNKINKFLFVNLLNHKLDQNKRKIVTKFFLSKKNKLYNKEKILRRCVLTNRARVSNSIYGISRIKFKELLSNNQIPGFYRKVW